MTERERIVTFHPYNPESRDPELNRVHCERLTLYGQTFDGYAPLRVEVGCNSRRGSWAAAVIRISGERFDIRDLSRGFEIVTRGSEQRDNVIRALKFMVEILERSER